MNNTEQSNMAWSEESLILFFYDELEPMEATKLAQELAQSEKLQKRYQAVTEVLQYSLNTDIPRPSEQLNQNIMAAVYQSIDAKPLIAEQTNKPAAKPKHQWLMRILPSLKLSHAFSFAVFAILGVSLFYMGRASVESSSQQQWVITDESKQRDGVQPAFSQAESQRVLYASLEKHLNSSSRLLTNIVNTDDSASTQLSQRNQQLDDLISFNRMYRQIISKSGDRQLSHLLMQMESILLELRNAKNESDHQSAISKSELLRVKQRLDNSDLLFKLKVTNKKIQQRKI